MHLNDEQLDELLDAPAGDNEHVAVCPACRERLGRRRALRDRVRSAFASLAVSEGLEARVRQTLSRANAGVSEGADERAGAPVALTPARRGRLAVRPRRWPAYLAYAAALLLAAGLLIFVPTIYQPSPAAADQALLASIHEHNISPDVRHDHDFYVDADPARMAAFLKERLGFDVAFPRLGQGMSIRSCCTAYFRNSVAGSYVVQTPQGPISIIVITDRPQTLGMTRLERPGQTHEFWSGAFARNQMIAVRLGDYTYCAVGEVSPQLLSDLLDGLLPSRQ